MQWTKPEFTEISLGGELTAYVNTDDQVRVPLESSLHTEARREPTEILYERSV